MRILSASATNCFQVLASAHGELLGGRVGLKISNAFDATTTNRLIDDYLALSQAGSQFLHISDATPDSYRESVNHPQSKVPTVCARATMLGKNMAPNGILHRVVQTICALKDLPPDEVFSAPSSGRYWTSTVTFYPSGGGWLGSHKDPEDIYGGIHILLNMSTRGVHYERGGLYLLDDSASVIDIEPHWQAGDLLMFNAEKIAHGVSPVDPTKEKPSSALAFPKKRSEVRGRFSCQTTRVVLNR